MSEHTVLELRGVKAAYGSRQIINDIDLFLNAGDITAIVGESGCGKSTLLRAILSLPNDTLSVEGEVVYNGTAIQGKKNAPVFGTGIGIIYQNPWASFNPIRTYKKQFTEMLKAHRRYNGADSLREVTAAFESLSLPEPDRILASCPFELSGGMNQRVAIASALLLRPNLLLLDEPTSALDVTTQKTVVEELTRLHDMTGMTMLLVTHNLGLAAEISNRIIVMYGGRIVEIADAETLLRASAHPYTRSLIAAVPKTDGTLPTGIDGQPPLYAAEKKTCAFCDRCPERTEQCAAWNWKLYSIGNGHLCACRRYEYEN